LLLDSGLTLEQIKALTPMTTVNEEDLIQIGRNAVKDVREKAQGWERKLLGDEDAF